MIPCMIKKPHNIAYIDGQNLYMGTTKSEPCWVVDLVRFRVYLEKKYNESNSEKVRGELEQYMMIEDCPSCEGQRLNDYARSVKIDKYGIMELSLLSLEDAYEFFKKLKFEIFFIF